MKVLNKLTINNLKLNKKRTTVTIIGIILSTALICAVAGVFSSFQKTIVKSYEKEPGNFHVNYKNVPEHEIKYIINNREVEKFFYTQDVGYSKLSGSKNENKPYLHLMEYDEVALREGGVHLISGRLPKNSNELLISKHIETNGGVKYNVGDKIKIKVGKRMSNGEELDESNPFNYEVYNEEKQEYESNKNTETIENTVQREFTIVGVIQRLSYQVETYNSPGYTVITLMDNINERSNVYVKYKNPRKAYNLIKDVQKVDKMDEIYRGKYNLLVNTELLMFSGVARSEGTMNVVYGLIAIVIGIIIVASVFVIRNSFAISVSERMKQIGMISSVGATKKQIKKNVLYEGFILGIIGIPLGILSGVFATYILILFSKFMVGDMMDGMEFTFYIPLGAILISIFLGGVTIYLSTKAAAKKASKISPIEAIRSNNDIKIKAKKIKSPKLIKKIFGIGGDIAYKNLKRNKSKYRTTVISLVVSITIFISLSTFINYVFSYSGLYYEDVNFDLSIYIGRNEKREELYKKVDLISKLDGVKNYSFLENMYLIENSNIDKFTTEDGKKYFNDFGNEDYDIISIGEEPYKKFIKKLGLEYEEVKDKAIYLESGERTYNKKRINVLNINKGDVIKGEYRGNKAELEIAMVTKEMPIGVGNRDMLTFLISNEKMSSYSYDDDVINRMYIEAEDADNVEKQIIENEDLKGLEVDNYKKQADQQKRMVIWISVFLYGFIIVISLIGITNIFNTITTNMNLRSKEFAMLKSIGMTKKEFNKMINLESIFYGTKSLFIGIILGCAISYWIYKIVCNGMDFGFTIPIKSIIISIIFVMIIVGIIMRYSLKKINKQNIIETIRKDNI